MFGQGPLGIELEENQLAQIFGDYTNHEQKTKNLALLDSETPPRRFIRNDGRQTILELNAFGRWQLIEIHGQEVTIVYYGDDYEKAYSAYAHTVTEWLCGNWWY